MARVLLYLNFVFLTILFIINVFRMGFLVNRKPETHTRRVLINIALAVGAVLSLILA